MSLRTYVRSLVFMLFRFTFHSSLFTVSNSPFTFLLNCLNVLRFPIIVKS